jgi:hypothetical protein
VKNLQKTRKASDNVLEKAQSAQQKNKQKLDFFPKAQTKQGITATTPGRVRQEAPGCAGFR